MNLNFEKQGLPSDSFYGENSPESANKEAVELQLFSINGEEYGLVDMKDGPDGKIAILMPNIKVPETGKGVIPLEMPAEELFARYVPLPPEESEEKL